MSLADIIQLIGTNGTAIVIIAYFLFKDYKFNGQLINLMQEIKEVLSIMREGK